MVRQDGIGVKKNGHILFPPKDGSTGSPRTDLGERFDRFTTNELGRVV